MPDLQAATAWYTVTFGLEAAPPFTVPGTDLSGVMLLHVGSGYRIELCTGPVPLTASPRTAPTTRRAPSATGTTVLDVRVARVIDFTAVQPQGQPPGARQVHATD